MTCASPAKSLRVLIGCETSGVMRRAFAALAEYEAATDTTWHERRTMLPDGDARAVKARGE